MREREPIVESYPPVKLDEHIFDNLAEAVKLVEDEKEREFLDESIRRCKRGSLEYAEETLNVMLWKEKPKEEKKEEEMTEEKHWAILGGKEGKPSHAIVSYMSGLGLVMNELGIPREGWPAYDPEGFKHQQPLKAAALRYAFGEALEYEKLTRDRGVSRNEALARLGLKGVVKADFLEKHVVEKIDKLPVDLREHLIE